MPYIAVVVRSHANVRNRTRYKRRNMTSDAARYVAGDWSQVADRGDCTRCRGTGIWLYFPVKEPERVVCGHCVAALTNRGIAE